MAAKKPIKRKPTKRKSNWEDDSKSPVPPPLKKAKRPQKENRRLNYQDSNAYNRTVRIDDSYLGAVGSSFPGQDWAQKGNYRKQEKLKFIHLRDLYVCFNLFTC
jgi:hypothetical protein